MGKVYFLFGVHNHQPVGNFEHIFKYAYERCYRPFLSLLEKFPKVKCSIHNSGPLYDWMFKNSKEYIDILKKMVKRGQVEIASGGYYEPILPLISDQDKYGQIKLMNDFIKKEFNQEPAGMWVAERVWEQYLARIIHTAGLKYTFLDDTHFRYAGLQEEEFLGYYTTEDEGKPIFIFPISKTLRYKIPFSEAHEAIDILCGFARDEDVLITLFDDGEKFGLWPDTFDWVWEKKWLEKFLSLLNESSVIETITGHEAIEKFSSHGIVYLPTASYEEMGEWVLEPRAYATYEKLKNFLKETSNFDEFKDFVRGGFFRNFYRKYSRLNYMHKRMLALSRRINSLADPKKDENIFRHLWKAQTNCGYWHGIFGGFYLSHIRAAIYENLITSQSLFDKKYKKEEITVEEEDIDLCGLKETLVSTGSLILCFSQKGGTILELSTKEPAHNFLNTITRSKESYHKKIIDNVAGKSGLATIHEVVKQKQNDLREFIVYDSYERLGLVDHIIDKGITVSDFNYQRGIQSLAGEFYDKRIKKGKDTLTIGYHYRSKQLDFTKEIQVSSDPGLGVVYRFVKKNVLNNNNFGVEFNLSLPSLEDIFKKEKKADISLREPTEWLTQRSFIIRDRYKKVDLIFQCDSANIFTLPIYSVSSSEAGFERVYQEISLLFIVPPKETFSLSLDIKRL